MIIQRNNITDPTIWDTIYTSNINFAEAKDNPQTLYFSAPTLDSNLREKLDAYSDNNYNVPYWKLVGGDWVPEDGVYGIYFSDGTGNGMKLLYNQLFTSGASNSITSFFSIHNARFYGGDDEAHLLPSLNTINLFKIRVLIQLSGTG